MGGGGLAALRAANRAHPNLLCFPAHSKKIAIPNNVKLR